MNLPTTGILLTHNVIIKEINVTTILYIIPNVILEVKKACIENFSIVLRTNT